MRKTIGVSSALVVLAVLVAGQASAAAASTTPRWTTHVRNYPGGISNGVRAYLDTGVASAQAGLGPVSTSAASRAPLNNLQVNSLGLQSAGAAERDPGGRQSEQPDDRRGGGERLRQRRLADLPDHRRRLSWTTQFRSSATKETGDFCGGGGDPALDLQQARPRLLLRAALLLPGLPAVRGRGDPLDRQRQDLEPVPGTGAYPVSNFSPEARRLQPGAVLRQGADHRRQQSVEPALRAAVRHLHQVPHARPAGSATTARCRSPTPTTSTPTATGDLGDAVWHRTKVVPDDPGGNGTGAVGQPGRAAGRRQPGRRRHLVHDRGVQHVARPRDLHAAVDQRRRELRPGPDRSTSRASGRTTPTRTTCCRRRTPASRPRPRRRWSSTRSTTR